MTRLHSVPILAVSVFCFLVGAYPAHAAKADRVAVEARVRAEVNKDLAMPYRPGEGLENRMSLDGRPVKDFQGDIVEYWANLECPFCGIQEPVLAQRENADVRIIVRHIPTREYGESLKKALSYEAIKKFSINAANMFWDKVVPKNRLGLPMPYEGALLMAVREAAITPETFMEAVADEAAANVNQDVAAALSRISITPTWVLAGIRFGACDFTAAQVRPALELAKQARAGDEDAKERIITIITNGYLNETML
jgi:hypothetical protein